MTGNGKTISMKAIMKECDAKGYAPLYVKSFKSWKGEEGSMEDVFSKAREMAPCVLILEDLDSLINDGNRSFFLNQLDGLEGNDGLLLIGSTNHFDRLDPALSGRPSRFDRKWCVPQILLPLVRVRRVKSGCSKTPTVTSVLCTPSTGSTS